MKEGLEEKIEKYFKGMVKQDNCYKEKSFKCVYLECCEIPQPYSKLPTFYINHPYS
jgi:hypothetical protein